MYPTDPSYSHLKDRAVEIRVVKVAVVLFLVSLAAIFYSLVPVIVVFAVGYIAYKFRYYTNRVGVYSNEDLTAKHDRLGYGMIGFGVATVATMLVIETAFPESWILGGFLSLPAVDFTDPNALLQDPFVPLAWVVVLVPAASVSYVGLQFRKRLLVGIDCFEAAVRATIWDSIARIPIALLWIAVLNMRPIFEVWEPVVDAIGMELNLVPEVTAGFAVVLGEAFEPILGGGIAAPAVVIGSYLTIQRRKYRNAEIPEVLGYRGFLSPSRESTYLNAAVPTAVYLLYTLAVFATVETVPLGEDRLLVAVALSALVGANVFGQTMMTVSEVSQWVGDNVDAVMIGLAVGLFGLVATGPFVGSDASLTTLAVTYPAAAVPVAYAGNRIARQYAIRQISSFVGRVRTGWTAFDKGRVDRLFVYSESRDDTLRATAIDGLANALSATTYRKDDALDVFEEAIRSDDEEIVRAGLRGFSTVLGYDRSKRTYDRLAAGGVPERIDSHLDSENEITRALAAGTVAQIRTIKLSTSDPTSHLNERQIRKVGDIVEHDPQNQWLADTVLEYFATLWTVTIRSDGEDPDPTDPVRQYLLENLIWISAQGTDDARLRAVYAVTGERAPADEERFDVALDYLDSERDETRYLVTHVVRSSLDRHADRVDTDQIGALLDDQSDAVRWMAAETIGTLLSFDPESGPQLLDRLVLYLEENQHDPGRVESAVIRALSNMDTEQCIDHPTISETIAGYVVRSKLVARPAARLLASLVGNSPTISLKEPVSAAIETGLTHDNAEVRLACLEAVVAIVDDSTENARQFVDGLGENIATAGRHGVLASVSLAQIMGKYPEEGLGILPELAAGLSNQTPIDNQSVPFLIRESTVGTVTVSIVEDVITVDPSQGEVVIEPLVELATTADRETLTVIFRILSEISGESPTESKVAVEVAAAQIESGRMRIRRDVAKILANVAAYHPETVAPFVDNLVIATDDASPRVRSPALQALQNVCTALPEVIDSEIHRIIGRLDDDSAVVRKHAADLISTVADRKPEIIDPAAETADRLRRLQRDPAVNVDPDRLQDASTAIQTGVATEETESGRHEKEEIWSPETAEEIGISGETEVFEPVGDDFDLIESAEVTSKTSDDKERSAVDTEDRDTVIEPDQETSHVDNTEDRTDVPTESVGDRETVIESGEMRSETDGDEESSAVDTEDLDTVIDPDKETSNADDTEEQTGDES